jgi:serine/threonine-protein kinase
MPRAPGTHIDHYDLIEHLGDGAYAEVHRAKDTRTGDEVVLRFPHPRVLDNPALVSRWRREAQLTERLDHPNLQCRHAVGDHRSEPYLVFDYAAGGSLDHIVSGDAPLPVDQVTVWGTQAASAIAYLHGIGIVHRDIKPSNILLTDTGGVKLADFGAAVAAPKARRWWQLPSPPEGTPGYLSPEEIVGQPGDQRSDIYSWGIIMYELLTGHVPFTEATQLDALQAHLTANPPPIRAQRADVSPQLEAVVLHAMRRHPDNRYQSMRAVLDDLEHLDQVDPGSYDLAVEPPMHGAIGGAEGPAIIRLILIVAGGFIAIVTLAILLSLALR